MNGTGYIPSDAIVAANDIVLHEYATGEDLTLEVTDMFPAGDPIEIYRTVFGYYCTSDSSLWTLPAEDIEERFQVEISGKSLHLPRLISLFDVRGPSGRPSEPSKEGAEELLRQIRSSRAKIQARVGILTESYQLIREDRER